MNSSKFLSIDSLNDATEQHLRFVIDPDSAGMRLDQWLGKQEEFVSREMARRLILEGEVQVNGHSVQPASKVKPEDVVEVHIPPPTPSQLKPFYAPLTILFEDDWLAVVDKPAGLAMHPSPGHRDDTLVHRLLAHCGKLSGIGGEQRPGIVHRLDKDTSGVVVIAKNDHAHQHLSAQFKSRTIHRIYNALVIGHPSPAKGKVDLPLGRHPKNPMKRAVVEDGKRAVTHWEVIQIQGPFCWLRLKLETGRTHQIRVHLKEKNWPVLGDALYGGNRFRGLRLPEHVLEILNNLNRQALHAAELGFEHPDTGKEMFFVSPLPKEFEDIKTLLDEFSTAE